MNNLLKLIISMLSLFLIPLISLSCINDEIAPDNVIVSDTSSPRAALNLGTLDDRDSENHYKEVTLNGKQYGRYQIHPGASTDANLSTRIERYFSPVANNNGGRRAVFEAIFRINSVDASHTYFVQTKDSESSGALTLFRAMPNPDSNNKFDIWREYITKEGGTFSTGARKRVYVTTVNKDTDFTVKMVAGFSSDGKKMLTNCQVNGVDSNGSHPYLSSKMRIRYGAYRAKQSKATIYVRNTKYKIINN